MTFEAIAVGAGLCVREAEPADEAAVLRVFDQAGDYFTAVNGDRALPGDFQSLFYAAPEGVAPETKEILVVERDGEIVGVVDVVPGHPDQWTAAAGLFLLAPAHRRQGVGSAVLRALVERGRERGLRTVTASIPAGWEPGAAFLTATGFRLHDPAGPRDGTGNRVVHRGEGPVVTATLAIG
ncbi:GNAT family N-acetyltransferase [Actinoplanes oblitus]|uniref:GNAT family N-acetyltransferase n=1 Tax=Actinoplanes oblitus TaxID=3040509 RepID=A0ABY8W4K4_9ACTN|nr:GNAT family N-acetyltransferase [Actinoplanes oblitus]WIM92784.1 GNAT family N-acetyltransferase [Actinoplanes oblitus]